MTGVGSINKMSKLTIVVMDKLTKKGYIVNVCVPKDCGIGRQDLQRENVVKYQDLTNDISGTYNK